jgi:hypothetical protein
VRRHLQRILAGLDVPVLLVAVGVAVGAGVGLTLLVAPGGGTVLSPETLPPASVGVPPGPRAVEAATLQRAAFDSLAELVLVLAGAAALIALGTALALELAGGSRRRRSLAVRSALGASPATLRRRLVRERLRPLIVRGVLGGAVLGVGLAAVLLWTWPGPAAPSPPGLALPVAALVVAGVVALVAAAPLRYGREPLSATLAAGSATPDSREGGLRRLLSVFQLAAGLAILSAVGGALLGAGPSAPVGATSGGDTLLVPLALDEALPPEARSTRWAALLERARSVPTLTSESIATPGAWSGLGRRDFVLAECGQCIIGLIPVPFMGEDVFHHVVSPGFFQHAGLRLLDGRVFEATDGPGAEPVAVVSVSFARENFEDGDPLGHLVRVGYDEDAWHTVIGVVDEPGGVALGRTGGPAPAIYLSLLQHPPDRAELALGGDVGPGEVDDGARPSVAALVAGLDGVEAGAPERLSERRRRERAPLDWFAAVSLCAAALALLAALVGAASVAAVEVRARRRELGVRAAVGASPRRLLTLVLGRNARATAVALLLSVPASVGVAGLLRQASGNLPLFDGGLFAGLGLLLVSASLLGALGPARSAARTDPARVLAGE